MFARVLGAGLRALAGGGRIPLAAAPRRGYEARLPVQWNRPTKPSVVSPTFGGDLEPAPEPARDRVAPMYAAHAEFERLDERARAFFTAGFLGGTASSMLAKNELIERVRRHRCDTHTAEFRLAMLTGQIRWLQRHLERFPYDRYHRHICKEKIERRQKFLKYLRRWDYKRYEWLLEKLNLRYREIPFDRRITRKKSIKRLIEIHCEEIRDRKMIEYKKALEAKRDRLLKEFADNPLPAPNYVHRFDDENPPAS